MSGGSNEIQTFLLDVFVRFFESLSNILEIVGGLFPSLKDQKFILNFLYIGTNSLSAH